MFVAKLSALSCPGESASALEVRNLFMHLWHRPSALAAKRGAAVVPVLALALGLGAGGLVASASTPTPGNHCPTVAPVPPITVDSGNTASGRLVGSDPDEDTLTYLLVGAAQHGTVTLQAATGRFNYSPNAGYNGPDSFTAAAVDSAGCQSEAVSIGLTVTDGKQTNHCPVAVADVGPAVDLFLCGAESVLVAGDFNTGSSSCMNSFARVHLDGRDSRDEDGDALSDQWYLVPEAGAPVLLAIGAETNVVLEPGIYTLRLVATDRQCTDSMDVDLHILTPAEALGVMVADLETVGLEARHRRPLVALLKSAAACFERCLCSSGVRQLEAFIHKVHAQVEPDRPEAAALLAGKARQILASLDCGEL